MATGNTPLLIRIRPGRAEPIEAITPREIRAEPHLLSGVRPIVAFEHPGDLVHRSLWVYEQKRLPLIAPGNDTLTVELARRYDADSLVCDARSCARLMPLLRRSTVPIREIIVIDTDAALRRLRVRDVRLVRATAASGAGFTEVRISGNARRTSRKPRAIPGIELYRPGDPSVRMLALTYTSGTTGVPKLFIKKNTGIPRAKVRTVATFDRLVFLLGTDRLAANFYTLATYGDMAAAAFLPLSARSIGQLDCATLTAFRPTDLITTPVLFRNLVEHLRVNRGLSALSTVRRIIISQSIPERSTYELARQTCPRAILLPRYGSSETGYVGVACPALSRRLLKKYLGIAAPIHPIYRTRIDRPDARGIGEVLIWRNGRWVRTGDAGQLEHAACPCGEKRVLIMRGRLANDRIGCVGAMFLRSEIDRVGSSLSRYIQDYRVEVGEASAGRARGVVRLHMVPTAALRKRADAKRFIAAQFTNHLQVTKSRTLDALIRSGIFAPVRVQFTDGFPDKTEKLQKLSR